MQRGVYNRFEIPRKDKYADGGLLDCISCKNYDTHLDFLSDLSKIAFFSTK